MNGTLLPATMKIIAACNPYRIKKGLSAKEDSMAGLIFDHDAGAHAENVGNGIPHPLEVGAHSPFFSLCVYLMVLNLIELGVSCAPVTRIDDRLRVQLRCLIARH